MILLATLIIVPLFIFIAPIITTAAAASNLEQNQR
jgi:ABC-type transport system involved in cytochrome bd biosynthesis fused ATPase/permease subunit